MEDIAEKLIIEEPETKKPTEDRGLTKQELLERADKTGIMELRLWPDHHLKEPAVPVDDSEFDEDLKAVTDAMLTTMYMTGGVGLAGPQVGLGKRVFVMDVDPRKRGANVIVNPVIETTGPKKVPMVEGCLSFPGVHKSIERPDRVILAYQDETGESFKKVFHGLAARVILHEIDHLDGKTFLDRMTKPGRMNALRDLAKERSKVERLSRQKFVNRGKKTNRRR